MNKIFYILILCLLTQTTLSAQTSVNDYKYIIIPKQFDFQSSEDQYQINSLTKFLFNKYGFTAFFEDENLPLDVSQNRCLSLKTNINKVKGFLITRLQIELIDCNGKVVSTSQVGETKVKEYAKAYNLALREAFQTYQYMSYKYQPKEGMLETQPSESLLVSEVNKVDAQKEIERLKKQVEVLKEEKEATQAIKEEVVSSTTESIAPKKVIDKDLKEVKKADDGWYANPIDNGFQVVDAKAKKIMVLLYSGAPDVYIVKGKDAVVFKNGEAWVYGINDGSSLKVNPINLKF